MESLAYYLNLVSILVYEGSEEMIFSSSSKSSSIRRGLGFFFSLVRDLTVYIKVDSLDYFLGVKNNLYSFN